MSNDDFGDMLLSFIALSSLVLGCMLIGSGETYFVLVGITLLVLPIIAINFYRVNHEDNRNKV